jgi:calcium binding protein
MMGGAEIPKKQRRSRSAAELDRLIQEALVDAYGEEEQRTAFYAMLEDRLAMPFKTEWIEAYRRWARGGTGGNNR